MFSAAMHLVATRLLRQRVYQKTAGLGIAGRYLPLSRLKIAARLIVVPGGGPRRKAFQPKGRAN